MEKDPDKSPEENFLARWSRRKVETAEHVVATDAPQSGGALSERRSGDAGDDTQGTQTTKEILTDEQMPPIESLTEDSDFSGFLSPGVSEGLRKQALRKLFSSPGFNIRDGLDDYDDDFRNFAALGDLITSDMKHQMELEEERKRKAREAETEAEAQPEPAQAEEAAPEDQADTETPPAQETTKDADADDRTDNDGEIDKEHPNQKPADKKSS